MHTIVAVDYDSLLVLADLRQAGTRTATWVFGSAKKSLSFSHFPRRSPWGSQHGPCNRAGVSRERARWSFTLCGLAVLTCRWAAQWASDGASESQGWHSSRWSAKGATGKWSKKHVRNSSIPAVSSQMTAS